MTEIETLREAARLMRERAEAATSGRWYRDAYAEVRAPLGPVVSHDEGVAVNEPDAGHIASWDPAVALSVADWLDGVASRWLPSLYEGMLPNQDAALNVARTYLREAS